MAKQTPVAEVSLALHGNPSTRTSHAIRVRARASTGSTGVLYAALYEGTINRSGNLVTSTLTNTLATYSLAISDSAAASIGDYSNLTLKFWGYDLAGNALTVEVANIYLELPPSTEKATPVAQISLASHGVPATRTNHTVKVRARTTSGSTGRIRAALYEGPINRSGTLTSSLLTNSLADYSLSIPDAGAAAITDYSNLTLHVWGYDSAGNALTFAVANVYLELPVNPGSTTYFGQIVAPFTFFKAVNAGGGSTVGYSSGDYGNGPYGITASQILSSLLATFSLSRVVQGRKKTFAQAARVFTFGRSVRGSNDVAPPIDFEHHFLEWDKIGEKFYQAGVDRGVLYLNDGTVVVWNGLTNVEESTVSELKSYYLNGVKYLENLSPGEFVGKLKAYTYPDEFDSVSGIQEISPGLTYYEQPSKSFNVSYRTRLGNDLLGEDYGYKIHILYNIKANPDSVGFQTKDDSGVQAVEFTWTLTGVPSKVQHARPTTHIAIDSTKTPPEILNIIEDTLYGTETTNPSLLSAQAIGELFGNLGALLIVDYGDGTWSAIDLTETNAYISMIDETTFQIDNANVEIVDSNTYRISSTNTS